MSRIFLTMKTPNWRNQDNVEVYSTFRDDLHFTCEVLVRDRANDEPHGVRVVRWAKGKSFRVAWSFSRQHYQWL